VPMAVVGTAGTTNTGSIDDLRGLGEIARRSGAWFHVDGAYGLPGILDDRVAARYDGLELADSAIVDPHKWLGAPIGIGATFVRDRSLLHRAFTQEPAAYLETTGADDGPAESSLDSMGVPYADFGVELSAQARGVVVWSILRELGRAGVAARVRADDDHARRVAELAREHPRLELMLEPVLSVCCFRYRPTGESDVEAVNAEILRRLHGTTAFIPSSTRVRGRFALRPCFINPRTTPDLVDAFVAAVVAIGDEVVAGR
jgi:aromatic-L-amino-acid/L-tryptophan decarboxylase